MPNALAVDLTRVEVVLLAGVVVFYVVLPLWASRDAILWSFKRGTLAIIAYGVVRLQSRNTDFRIGPLTWIYDYRRDSGASDSAVRNGASGHSAPLGCPRPPHSGLSAPLSLNITFNPFLQSAARPTRSTSIPGAK